MNEKNTNRQPLIKKQTHCIIPKNRRNQPFWTLLLDAKPQWNMTENKLTTTSSWTNEIEQKNNNKNHNDENYLPKNKQARKKECEKTKRLLQALFLHYDQHIHFG